MTTQRNHTSAVRAAAGLEIETRRVGEAVVCALSGDLHLDNEGELREALARALDVAPTLLAVDLSAVALLTSSGLNVLLTTRRHALARKVPFVAVAPSPLARRVLRITRADLVLPVYPSLERAVRRERRSPRV
ncbi:STAS domain-containing protein [Streptomyces sp. NPDC015232]|uniref:STAS domain-containing protein n=1 Tax=unclassified Streptomyces TaxID=2593676 RepID=UPI0037006067